MNDEERYLFDVQGFLLIEDVLSTGELAALNGLLDSYDLWQNKGTGRFDEIWTNDPDFITVGPAHLWDEPFRRLLDHPKMLPYLTALAGTKFRYDHGHALLMRQGATHLRLHGGGAPFSPDCYYLVRDGTMYNGLIAVQFVLVDHLPGQGGFAAIPGSHKANFPCPREFLQFEKTGPWVVHVPAKAGSAIIFTEALTHGTWPWTADYERRVLLYKYTPGHMAWAGETPDATPVRLREAAAQSNGWSAQERRILTPPSVAGRPDTVEVH